MNVGTTWWNEKYYPHKNTFRSVTCMPVRFSLGKNYLCLSSEYNVKLLFQKVNLDMGFLMLWCMKMSCKISLVHTNCKENIWTSNSSKLLIVPDSTCVSSFILAQERFYWFVAQNCLKAKIKVDSAPFIIIIAINTWAFTESSWTFEGQFFSNLY